MTIGMFRWGSRVYTSRPPANCRSARQAWDRLSARSPVPIKDMHLMDGYWTCERENGELDDCENVFELDRRRREAGMYDDRSG